MNALVCGIEVNDRHGVGIYLRRLFPRDEDFLVFRSRSLYGGGSEFGAREVFVGDRFGSMGELRERLAEEAVGVKRILCVPYYPEDFRVGALLQEVTGAPMCAYLMDDQNVCSDEVGDAVVRRLIERSAVCLGISPQMCAGYEAKFGRKFWWLPPVVSGRKVGRSKVEGLVREQRCALLGNFWSARQLGDFRAMVRGAGWSVDWFGKGPEAAWLGCDSAGLADDGIFVRGFLSDEVLVERLSGFDFAVVPSGRMDGWDDKFSFAAMSFPSRMIYLFTQAGLPVLLVGSERSAAGAFLRATGAGLVCGYDRGEFVAAAGRLVAEAGEFRAAVERVAGTMVLPEGGEWIWRSMGAGRAVDDRFEVLGAGVDRASGVEVTARRERCRKVSRLSSLRCGCPPGGGGWWLAFDFSRWRYSRKAQLGWIRRRTAVAATGPHTFAVGTYQRALAAAFIRKFVRKGGRIRLLGGSVSDLRPVARDFEVVTEGDGGFDAVVSFDRADAVSREELDALGGARALQVHCWTAYLHPGHLEVAGAGRELFREIEDGDALVERMMDDREFLFMSPRALAEFWPGVDADRIGRAFSLNLCWRTGK